MPYLRREWHLRKGLSKNQGWEKITINSFRIIWNIYIYASNFSFPAAFVYCCTQKATNFHATVIFHFKLHIWISTVNCWCPLFFIFSTLPVFICRFFFLLYNIEMCNFLDPATFYPSRDDRRLRAFVFHFHQF